MAKERRLKINYVPITFFFFLNVPKMVNHIHVGNCGQHDPDKPTEFDPVYWKLTRRFGRHD